MISPQPLSSHLATLDPRGTTGRRLIDNSSRLAGAIRHLLTLNLIPTPADAEAMELACSALQLVQRHPQTGRGTLRDRAESAAELLINIGSTEMDPQWVERTCRLLRQIPNRSPAMAEARLLADAVNLEDFGLTGVLSLMAGVTLAGDGITHLLEAWSRREHYGYWDARLASFHFEAVRELALQRLTHARQFCSALRTELLLDPS